MTLLVFSAKSSADNFLYAKKSQPDGLASFVGRMSVSYYEGDLLYYPDRCPMGYYDMPMTFFRTTMSTGNSVITEDMPIGVTNKCYFEEEGYWSWESVLEGPTLDVVVQLD